MSIYEKLMNIQAELKAPKNQYNNFSDFYYRSCEDILEGLKPLLLKEKVVLLLTDSVEVIGDRNYIVATATLVDVESGDKVVCAARAREAATRPKFDDAQLTGTASSYARKYALNGMFCIDDTKDADTTEYQQPKQQQDKPKPKINAKQAAELEIMAKKKGVQLGVILKWSGFDAAAEMDVESWSKAMNELRKRADVNG